MDLSEATEPTADTAVCTRQNLAPALATNADGAPVSAQNKTAESGPTSLVERLYPKVGARGAEVIDTKC